MSAHKGRFGGTVKTLEAQMRKSARELQRLEAEREALQARHSALLIWMRAMEAVDLVSAPLRAAAAAAIDDDSDAEGSIAAENGGGGGGRGRMSEHLRRQEGILQQCLSQLRALRLQPNGGGGGGSSGKRGGGASSSGSGGASGASDGGGGGGSGSGIGGATQGPEAAAGLRRCGTPPLQSQSGAGGGGGGGGGSGGGGSSCAGSSGGRGGAGGANGDCAGASGGGDVDGSGGGGGGGAAASPSGGAADSGAPAGGGTPAGGGAAAANASPGAAAAPAADGGGGAAPPLPAWARLPDECGPPGEALRAYQAYTPEKLLARMRETTGAMAVDLTHIGCPSAAAPSAAGRVADTILQLLALHARIVAINPVPHARAVVRRVDTMDLIEAPTPRELWVHVVLAMRLAPRQERLMRALLDVYTEDMDRVIALRVRLLREAEACDEDEAQELLEEVETCQLHYSWKAITCTLALLGDILEPEQVARAVVAAYPYTLLLVPLHQALQDLEAERADNAPSPPPPPPPPAGGRRGAPHAQPKR